MGRHHKQPQPIDTRTVLLTVLVGLLLGLSILGIVLGVANLLEFREPPVPTVAPASITPTTQSNLTHFGDGQYQVGLDLAPGTYHTAGQGNCYWEVDSDYSGTIGRNENVHGPTTVTLAAQDRVFIAKDCGEWRKVR